MSVLSGGRDRPPSRDAHRALLLLVLVLVLVNLALWLTAGARGARGPAGGHNRVKASSTSGAVAAIAREFGTGPLGGCMLHLAERESGLDPHAANWSDHHSDGSRGSFGLFQIGALWRARGEPVLAFARRMFDAAANAALAHRIYLRGGLSPWGGRC